MTALGAEEPDIEAEYPRFTLSGLQVHARVLDVVDGDTLTVAFPVVDPVQSGRPPLGHAVTKVFTFKLRLHGINADEMKDPDVTRHASAVRARDRLVELVTGGATVASMPAPADGTNSKRGLKEETCMRKAIREYLRGHPCTVRVHCKDFDCFGRVLARVFPAATNTGDGPDCPGGGPDCSEVLLSEQLAHRFAK